MTTTPTFRHRAIGQSFRLAFLAVSGLTATAAFLLVPPAKGPPAIALGIASVVAGIVLGTVVAFLLRRVDRAPQSLQRRRDLATLAAGVLLVTSAVFLVNGVAPLDTGLGVELPILAVATDGEVTTIGLDPGSAAPILLTPKSGATARIGGCLWLASKRGRLGAGIFEIPETRICSQRRGALCEGHAPSLVMPPNGEKTDWRWAG